MLCILSQAVKIKGNSAIQSLQSCEVTFTYATTLILIGIFSCPVYLESSDDMTQTLVAIAFGKVKDTEDLKRVLDWSLSNFHLQHLNCTISAAFSNPSGNEAAMHWFFDNFPNVCRLCFIDSRADVIPT